MKPPWTRKELAAMRARMLVDVDRAEERYPDIRPLAPLTAAEALDLLLVLAGAAQRRPLTEEEGFLHGQLLSAYRMAIRAETLGYEGRYFVLSEEDVWRAAKVENDAD